MSSDGATQQQEESLGKRVSKKPAFYTTETKPVQEKKTTTRGGGVILGEYPYFVEQVGKLKGDDEVLKGLHNVLFNTPGKKLEVKKHLKVFNGFSKDANLQELTEKVAEKKKVWTVANLKIALGLFGLEKGGDREELCKRLVDYLAKPEILKSANSKGKSGSKKRKSKASAGGPKKKRAPSAFILFGQAKRPEIKEANPDASFGEIGKLVGEAWNSLDHAEKKEWEDKAAKAKAAMESEDQEEGEEEEEEEEEGDDEEAAEEESNDNAEA